jgi:hypothetical protein
MNSWFQSWLNVQPLWLIALLVFLATSAAASFGAWSRRRIERRRPLARDQADHEGVILSAVLALLGLLLGFTFSLAVERYEGRRLLVLADANAVEEAYLRAQLLEEPHRGRISGLLARYADNRIALDKALVGTPAVRPLSAANDRLIADLWTATKAAFPSVKPYDFSSTFLDTMNRLIERDAARKAAHRARVPPAVLTALFIYVVGSAGMLGYAARDRRFLNQTLLFGLLTLVLCLIIDIDRPTRGLIREDQRPMEDVVRMMSRSPPQLFDRWQAAPGPGP